MRREVFFILSLVALVSCRGGKDKAHLIPEKDMVKIIADIHLADAMANSPELRGYYNDLDSMSYSREIFAKYGYSKERFDSTVAWYSGYPAKYDKLYEKVLNRLNRMDANLKMLEGDTTEQRTDLWNLRQSWNLPLEGAQNKIEFTIPLEGTGIYSLTARIKCFPDDSSRNPTIKVWFEGKTADKTSIADSFPAVPINKDFPYYKTYTLSKEVSDTQYIQIRGRLLDHDAKEGLWKKHILVRDVRLLFEPSDSLKLKD